MSVDDVTTRFIIAFALLAIGPIGFIDRIKLPLDASQRRAFGAGAIFIGIVMLIWAFAGPAAR